MHQFTSQARKKLGSKQVVTDDFINDDLPGGIWRVSRTRDVRLKLKIFGIRKTNINLTRLVFCHRTLLKTNVQEFDILIGENHFNQDQY